MKRKKGRQPAGKKTKKRVEEGKTFVGKLDVSRQGTGFVIVEDLSTDIRVPEESLLSALNGDKVRVMVRKVGSSGRLSGEIVEVVERGQEEFVGKVEMSEAFAFVVPLKDDRNPDIYVPLKKLAGAKHADKVVVRVTDWETKNRRPEGEVIEIITGERENEIAMKAILVEHGFPLQFSKKALDQAKRLPDVIDEAEIKNRKDCRDWLTLTIDPKDAKDFDDALSIRKLKNGNYEVGVHIADVSHYVVPGTVLDSEAYARATSVYFPDRVLPMLPERISNDLCSLRPDEDKLAFSVIFQFDGSGAMRHHWIGKTVIRSKKRLSYEQVQEVIEAKDGDLSEELLTLHQFAQQLRQERFSKGAINFSSQEIRFTLDSAGKPVGITVTESKEAHQLIEEFMLLANRTVAIYINKQSSGKSPIPFPYRVHDFPNEEKLEMFAAFASRFGYKFNLNNPDDVAASFNEMLRLVEGKPEQRILEQLGIRTMSKAFYTTDNIGHYGLGFEYYCHFTSPIRRYPDILAHRVLNSCLLGKPEIDKKMEVKAKHCSEQEREAMDAERTADKYKQVEYMQDFVGEDFEAVISGVATIGFWAETLETKCEGLVSIADLSTLDDFQFVEREYALIGLHHGYRFRIGDTVRVKIVSTNLEKLQIDMDFVQEEKKGKGKPKEAKSKKTKSNKKGPKKNAKKKVD